MYQLSRKISRYILIEMIILQINAEQRQENISIHQQFQHNLLNERNFYRNQDEQFFNNIISINITKLEQYSDFERRTGQT